MVNEEEEEENEEEMMKKEELENQERGRAMVVDTRYLKDFYWFSDISRFLWGLPEPFQVIQMFTLKKICRKLCKFGG